MTDSNEDDVMHASGYHVYGKTCYSCNLSDLDADDLLCMAHPDTHPKGIVVSEAGCCNLYERIE